MASLQKAWKNSMWKAIRVGKETERVKKLGSKVRLAYGKGRVFLLGLTTSDKGTNNRFFVTNGQKCHKHSFSHHRTPHWRHLHLLNAHRSIKSREPPSPHTSHCPFPCLPIDLQLGSVWHMGCISRCSLIFRLGRLRTCQTCLCSDGKYKEDFRCLIQKQSPCIQSSTISLY